MGAEEGKERRRGEEEEKRGRYFRLMWGVMMCFSNHALLSTITHSIIHPPNILFIAHTYTHTHKCTHSGKQTHVHTHTLQTHTHTHPNPPPMPPTHTTFLCKHTHPPLSAWGLCSNTSLLADPQHVRLTPDLPTSSLRGVQPPALPPHTPAHQPDARYGQ